MNDFFLSLLLLGSLSENPSFSPFWMGANQYGIDPEGRGAAALLQTGSQYELSNAFQWGWGISAGALTDSFRPAKLLADEAYISLKYKSLSLDLGQKRRPQDFLAPGDDLGTISTTGGNMIWSGNASALPGYTLSLAPVRIPFTAGHALFFGRFADYRTIDRRNESDVMVHNTCLGGSLVFGKKEQLKMSLVLDHYSMWGGEIGELGKVPTTLADYGRILVGGRAPSTDMYTLSDRINVMGNHLGRILLRLDYQGSHWHLTAQHDHPYEDTGGMKGGNAPDGVNTLHFSFDRDDRWITDILYEFQFTRWQAGTCERRPATAQEIASDSNQLYLEENGEWSYIMRGADDYFWNCDYTSGWTHFGRTIGNPLFFPAGTLEGTYNPSLKSRGIENNRLLAHHFALAGKIFRAYPYRIMMTWSSNLGRYREDLYTGTRYEAAAYNESLSGALNQFSGGFQCEIPILGGLLKAVPGFWFDFGDVLADNMGVSLSLRYNFR